MHLEGTRSSITKPQLTASDISLTATEARLHVTSWQKSNAEQCRTAFYPVLLIEVAGNLYYTMRISSYKNR